MDSREVQAALDLHPFVDFEPASSSLSRFPPVGFRLTLALRLTIRFRPSSVVAPNLT